MSDYERIANILRYLDQHHAEQPDLAKLAEYAGLSRFHFHRLFSRWAGVSPKDFLQCLTLSHAKELLRRGEDVLSASLSAGLSGPGRLHDLCVNLEAATPGEIKLGGAGWIIHAGFAPSPFGNCLAAESPRGICHLSFAESRNRQMAAAAIAQDWPSAKIQWDDATMSQRIAPLFTPTKRNSQLPLRAHVRGTNFQIRVWLALLKVPPGSIVSYNDLAAAVCTRNATRAVASAVARNPLAYLIPCHRVIRNTGVLGNYRWDPTRKKAILAWENAAAESDPAKK
jgi:AraC family transcriptional regulator of adaptative response/methylated-DNA-[protein]-cysteine methyltransferase